MLSSVELCLHGQVEGTIPIRECADPKRVWGKVYRNAVRHDDPIGCPVCGMTYVWSLRTAARADDAP